MQKGAYAKGIAKRDEILRTALDVIARNGYRRTSVRELADEVRLSQAGLLHYFASKDELFVEILRKRDEVDLAMTLESGLTGVDALIAIVRHNAEVPGLVELYSVLSAEATEPSHPAHAFIGARYVQLREALRDDIRERQKRGDVPAHLDADQLAVAVVALSDGLQTQWLLDPAIDMAGTIERTWAAMIGRPDAPRP
jgi:AcrR family transcriptional regulator